MDDDSQDHEVGVYGYIKDKLTTLKPATDRIFGTRATVTWNTRQRRWIMAMCARGFWHHC